MYKRLTITHYLVLYLTVRVVATCVLIFQSTIATTLFLLLSPIGYCRTNSTVITHNCQFTITVIILNEEAGYKRGVARSKMVDRKRLAVRF